DVFPLAHSPDVCPAVGRGLYLARSDQTRITTNSQCPPAQVLDFHYQLFVEQAAHDHQRSVARRCIRDAQPVNKLRGYPGLFKIRGEQLAASMNQEALMSLVMNAQ